MGKRNRKGFAQTPISKLSQIASMEAKKEYNDKQQDTDTEKVDSADRFVPEVHDYLAPLTKKGVYAPSTTTTNGKASCLVDFNQASIIGFNYNIVHPGDVILTAGIFPPIEEAGAVLGKENRPAIVLAAEHGTMQVVALSTNNGYEGTITGRRICSIPPVLKSTRNVLHSYIDISQIHTADQSCVERIVAKIDKTILDYISAQIYKWYVIERGGHIEFVIDVLRKSKFWDDVIEVQKIKYLEEKVRELEKKVMTAPEPATQTVYKADEKLLSKFNENIAYSKMLEEENEQYRKEIEKLKMNNESLMKELAEVQESNKKKEEKKPEMLLKLKKSSVTVMVEETQKDPGENKNKDYKNLYTLENAKKAHEMWMNTKDRGLVLGFFGLTYNSRSNMYYKFRNLKKDLDEIFEENNYSVEWDMK